MKTYLVSISKILFLVAATIYVLLGIGHLIGHYIIMSDLDGSLTYITMNMVEVKLFFMERTVWEFLNGFSLTMGVLLMSAGLFNLINFLQFRNKVLKSLGLLFFNFLLALVITFISIVYFTGMVIAFYSLIALIFLVLMILALLKSDEL